MNNEFLIPANSKKGLLIANLFTITDLIVAGIGGFIFFILLITIGTDTLTTSIIVLSPVLIAGLLVFPIPNYHNGRVAIMTIINFLTSRQKYIWKGWCVYENFEQEKK